MACSSLKKVLFVLLCIFIIIFPFCLIVRTYATENDVELNVLNNAVPSSSSQIIIESTNYNCYYFKADEGYKYTVNITGDNRERDFRYCYTTSDTVDIGTTVNNITFIQASGDISFGIPDSFSGYICIIAFSQNLSDISVTSTPIGMSTAVGGLVDNVGINSIWNIFDISINYIVIVVLVAFGIFIITRIVRKISKGKEGL